jgi:predicted O-linked N-acetylglucosamine transferase (SPINDLY family)
MDIRTATKSAIDHLQAGNLQQAEQIFKEILLVQPDNVTALHFTGVIYYQRKQYAQSIHYIREALSHAPDYADAHNNLGIILQESGQIEEAIQHYKEAIALNPDFDRAHYNLGIAFREQWQVNHAIEHYQKAIQINPHFFEAYNNLGLALQDQGKLEDAEAAYRHALRIKPDFAMCYSNLLLLMNYNSRHDVQTVFAEHLRFAKQIAEPLSSEILPHANTCSPSRRLKIGYVSPDFRRHSVNYFIEPVLASHDHEQFEIFCYSDVLRPDNITERLQHYADHWRGIVGLPDERVADLIRNDAIDILVDLAGHTAHNRLLVFARKPAPVQVTWLGYPPTTGLSSIDYKIVDHFSHPEGENDTFFTEQLLRLPGSFLCYLPDKDSPEVGPLPSLSTGYITFGSFNNFAKVTTEVVALWARILAAVPGSKLLVKWNSFSDNAVCQYATGMFTKRGIDPERIILQSSDPSPKHLDAYNLVDVGLDTFPFNGLTTTCEALWMGVPVITLAGKAYASRGSASLLSNIGMPELIAKTSDEYVTIAIALAKNMTRMKSLRWNLRSVMLRSPLIIPKRFTRNLETMYRQIWSEWCSKRNAMGNASF